MTKRKKRIIAAAVLGAVLLTIFFIWLFIIPHKLMSFTSDDGKISVVISQYKAIGPFAEPDYNIKIKETGGVFDKTLLSENFEYSSFKHGKLEKNNIDIEWNDDNVVVLIEFAKGRCHRFTAEF